ncbi:uncharacterized protein PAC_05957 [Phialocephala subalpina]|uniref:Uncharacterized protein n=1 Tax=Phialocephala subalpina TaxID=576137 RepID=A0A1L7WTJ0_9HELO|nr:uncharacterized protein PAC_05957 [Phialocephala subalpina]
MASQAYAPSLPRDLEEVFSSHEGDREALLKAFMPVFCDHVRADRIFLQPRNPETRVCKVFRWRRNENIPCIYVEDLEEAAKKGILNLDFERNYMFHTALIHGHAHWPPLNVDAVEERRFYGSVQPAVFDGPRVWSTDTHELVEKCLARIAPIMKAYGENAPPRSSFEGLYFRGVLDTSGMTSIQS